jgi:hypothetical protein
MKPTPEQITAEIAKLKLIKPKIREHNAFGDSIHKAIDAQIAALEGDYDDTCDEFWEQPDHTRSAQADAHYWAEGDEPISPSESWAALIIE